MTQSLEFPPQSSNHPEYWRNERKGTFPRQKSALKEIARNVSLRTEWRPATNKTITKNRNETLWRLDFDRINTVEDKLRDYEYNHTL